jgi:hypothetical protein
VAGQAACQDTPQALVDALDAHHDALEAKYGPYALRAAQEKLKARAGRPRKYGERLKLGVWLVVEIERRFRGYTKRATCRWFAKHGHIDEMNEGVGLGDLISPDGRRKPWLSPDKGLATWYDLHSEGARILQENPEKRAAYERAVNWAVEKRRIRKTPAIPYPR